MIKKLKVFGWWCSPGTLKKSLVRYGPKGLYRHVCWCVKHFNKLEDYTVNVPKPF